MLMFMPMLVINISCLPCKVIKLCMVICFFVFIQVSCTQEVELAWDDEEQKYVVNCLFSPDEQIELYVFKTTGILEDTVEFVNGLDIELYESDQLIWLGNNSEKGRYSIPVIPKLKEKYKIILKNHESFSITANDLIPSAVNILTATYSFPVYEDIYGTLFGKVFLSFRDNPEVKNYYEIVILGKDSSIIHTFNVKSPVITLDNENDPIMPGSLLFTDELFEGEKLDLNIYVDSYKNPIIVLKNVSRNYYEYRKSINSHFFNQNTERENIFELFKGDPLELYSNINNGLGIFAGFTQDVVKCKNTDE